MGGISFWLFFFQEKETESEITKNNIETSETYTSSLGGKTRKDNIQDDKNSFDRKNIPEDLYIKDEDLEKIKESIQDILRKVEEISAV